MIEARYREMAGEKHCPRCEQVKPLSAFCYDRKRGRHVSWCRECKTKTIRKTRQVNRLIGEIGEMGETAFLYQTAKHGLCPVCAEPTEDGLDISRDGKQFRYCVRCGRDYLRMTHSRTQSCHIRSMLGQEAHLQARRHYQVRRAA